jgi:hypothetical protein
LVREYRRKAWFSSSPTSMKFASMAIAVEASDVPVSQRVVAGVFAAAEAA